MFSCYCSEQILFQYRNFHDSICPYRHCCHFHCMGCIIVIILVIFFTIFWFVMKRLNWLQEMQVDREFASCDDKIYAFQLYIQFLSKVWFSRFSYLHMYLEHRYMINLNEIFTELNSVSDHIFIYVHNSVYDCKKTV